MNVNPEKAKAIFSLTFDRMGREVITLSLGLGNLIAIHRTLQINVYFALVFTCIFHGFAVTITCEMEIQSLLSTCDHNS